jgi:hypothetical protein
VATVDLSNVNLVTPDDNDNECLINVARLELKIVYSVSHFHKSISTIFVFYCDIGAND